MIKQNLEAVRERINSAAAQTGRSGEDITLIAVTKTHPADMINEAIRCGVTDIGENKVQEIMDKYDSVLPVRWHMIGHLQTNKVKYIIDKVSLIHSVDSVKLMDEIERRAVEKDVKRIDILIQINISGEKTKFGIKPEEVYELLAHAGQLSRVKVAGLMTVAPKVYNNITNSLYFDNIRQIFVDIQSKKYDNVNMRYLSMGMSGDYEAAVMSGSNMVRIGSAIFGKRSYEQEQNK